jgi:hypothetical protein
MSIVGTEGLSDEEIEYELKHGGKFVVYEYCISVILVSFKQPSAVHFVRAGESAVSKGMKYTLLSLVAGWWGFPWGPIYTIWALVVNLRGGNDVTRELTYQGE